MQQKTELNCWVQFSFTLCIKPTTIDRRRSSPVLWQSRTCDGRRRFFDSQEPATVVAGSLTVTNLRQSSPVLWQSRTCDGRRRFFDSQEPATVVAGSLTVKNLRRSSPVLWQSRTCDGRRRFFDSHEPATVVAGSLTVTNLRRPSSQLVAGSIHSVKLNWTQLSSTEWPSSVQFSFPQCDDDLSLYSSTRQGRS